MFNARTKINISIKSNKKLYSQNCQILARIRTTIHRNDVICDRFMMFYHKATAIRLSKMETSSDVTAQRSVIKYCVKRGMTPGQTIKEINSTKQYNAVSRKLIYKWHRRYSTGWEESGDKKGRPKELNNKILQTVSDVIRSERRLTVREIADIMGIRKSSVQRILTLELKMSRVCARWVPRRLTDDEMTRRVLDSKAFLRRHSRDKNFLNRILKMDETLVHFYEPEGKQQSSVWKTAQSPPAVKYKTVKSLGKVMLMVFMDNQGVVLSHSVRPGSSVDAAYYSRVICFY